jgi:sterol 24-C-methyltransferase
MAWAWFQSPSTGDVSAIVAVAVVSTWIASTTAIRGVAGGRSRRLDPASRDGLAPEEVERFFTSYVLFDGDWSNDNGKSDAHLVDYYRVLNLLCALGNVEKMYIPPNIDPGAGVLGNQVLYERRIMEVLGARAGMRLLDIGCGRGRIAAHVASASGAHVTGINIDESQVASAIEHARDSDLTDRLEFHRGSMNDGLPFADASFDGVYQVQAFSYAKDKPTIFGEVYRVMRPGAEFSFLDWVRLPGFQAEDAEHRSLLARTKNIIGAIDTPSPEELCRYLEGAGFEVRHSQDASVDGHQSELIAAEDRYFLMAKKAVDVLVAFRLMPRHMARLIDRLMKDADAFIEMDRRGLATSSYEIVARKPAAA